MRTDARTWGSCIHAFLNGQAEVDLLEIVEGGHSSVHCHHRKDNLFVLLDGAVDVVLFDDDVYQSPQHEEWIKEVVQLRSKGDSVIVPAGKYHRFVTIKPSKLVEVYLPSSPQPGDIDRATQNGIMSADELKTWAEQQR